GAGEKLSQDYNIPYLGSIPLDANVRVGGDSGKPIVVEHPESAAAEALQQLAKDVAARVSVLTIQSQDASFIPIQMIG
ncbi:MAG: P-loop NTPase, partial [Anaerolineales bacterium]|nr:P-loop NTPase [Anaerolineales bacterium]